MINDPFDMYPAQYRVDSQSIIHGDKDMNNDEVDLGVDL